MLARQRDDAIGAATYADAETLLGYPLATLDSAEALSGTEATQMALLVCAVADARRLANSGVVADFVAGHSIGAFAAAVCAEALDFTDALRLVAIRGRAMNDAQPHGFGMAAIVGVPENTVQQWIDAITICGGTLYLTNRNAVRQFAVSGADADLDTLIDIARKNGANKAMRLAVAVPSHSPLMQSVVPKLRTAIDAMRVRAPRIPYASNHTARLIRDAAGVADDLVENVAQPVRWSDLMHALYERGVRTFVETRPGDVLTKIVQSSFDDVRAFALESTALPDVLAVLRRSAG
jgi:malonate decarboxylase epsilon subunit